MDFVGLSNISLHLFCPFHILIVMVESCISVFLFSNQGNGQHLAKATANDLGEIRHRT